MLRGAVSSLTLRGRAFIAAGLTAVGCALVFDQPALTRVGVLVVALAVVAVAVTAARRPAPAVEREVWPRLVRAGETARIDVHLHGTQRRGAGTLLVEDLVPYALGACPRFVLSGLGRGWRRELTYQVRPEIRGRFELGPLTVRVTDPFGLVERSRQVGEIADLVVTPRVLPLPTIPLTGGWHGAGEHRPQSFATGSSEDVSVREYRRGDDLRRVHWRSSARVGELMVRREEQPWEAYATVLLDNRADAHRGNGRASSFESAVIAAASAVVHLEQHGYTIQLVTTDGVCVAGCEQALHRLALAEETTQSTMDVNWSGDRARGGIVVGILGDFLPGDSGACRRIRHDAGAALALVVDVEQWSSTRQASVTASPLLALGWRATTIGPRDRLDTAWRDLGRAPARARAGR